MRCRTSLEGDDVATLRASLHELANQLRED
jgi:hypothetical protein